MRLLKLSAPLDLHRVAALRAEGARLFHAMEDDLVHAYLPDAAGDGMPMRRSLSIEGEAFGRPAPFRYVVETDVVPEHEADFLAWYAEEHMPGLAAVPGTVLAEQYLVEGDAPRYHSVYDLAAIEAFNSPPWLAVRATDWSSRVRPNFRNTIRTMFRAI